MATNTKNFKFKKPDESDFYDVQDQNGNWDMADEELEKLNAPTFEDYSGGALLPEASSAIDGIKSGFSLPTLLSNIKAAFKGACLLGHIVNNCVTNRSDLPLSQGKVLMDMLTKLNGDFGTFYWSGTGNIEILSDKINNWVQDETNFITLPAGRYILGYKAHVQADSSVYIDTSIDTHDSDLPLYEKTMNMPVSCRDNVVFRSVNNVMIYAFTEKTSLYFNAYASASLNVKFKIWATRIK